MTATETFTLTKEHIALLRHSYVQWSDAMNGGAEIDPKRPYGNKNTERDIAEILAEPAWQAAVAEDIAHDDDAATVYYLARNGERLMELHRQTETALQVVRAAGSFEPGLYAMAKPYDSLSWKKVGEL